MTQAASTPRTASARFCDSVMLASALPVGSAWPSSESFADVLLASHFTSLARICFARAFNA